MIGWIPHPNRVGVSKTGVVNIDTYLLHTYLVLHAYSALSYYIDWRFGLWHLTVSILGTIFGNNDDWSNFCMGHTFGLHDGKVRSWLSETVWINLVHKVQRTGDSCMKCIKCMKNVCCDKMIGS